MLIPTFERTTRPSELQRTWPFPFRVWFRHRTKRLGFQLKVFDGGYIWHHKSKSYGDETRRDLSSKSKKTMRSRWGSQLKAAIQFLEANIQLMETRRRVQRVLTYGGGTELRVLFVLNPTRKDKTLAMHGGWISILNQALGLRQRGVWSCVAVSAWTKETFEANFPQLKDMEFLLTYPDDVRNSAEIKYSFRPVL